MTDQDKIARFADGEPLHPFGTPKHKWRTFAEIALTWTIVLAVLFGTFYLMFALLSVRHAHADEGAARIFEVDGECFIDTDLRVTGTRRAACVDKLETAARLARAEQRVNERRKR